MGVEDRTNLELSTHFLKLPLVCGVERRGSSFGDGCAEADINFLGRARPIRVGRIPAKGSFSCFMLVVRERFRYHTWRRLMSCGNRPRFLIRRFSSTTIQTSKYCDRKSCVQIHCPLR